MEPAGAYGAGKAGSVSFDPVAFFTHPRTILRLMSWVSLLCNVWADISGQAYLHPHLSPIHIVYVSRCFFQPAASELLEIRQYFFYERFSTYSPSGTVFKICVINTSPFIAMV